MILRGIALMCALGINATFALADIYRVVDEHGNPVSNAVVSIPLPEQRLQEPGITTTAIMDQVQRAFKPHVLVVRKNQPVNFPNSDNIRHHVYSFSQPNNFEIKLYSGEPSDPIVFKHPGVVVLGCNIHDQMKGYLYVTDQERAVVTDQNGLAQLETSPGKQVSVWHSRLIGGVSQRKTLELDDRDEQGYWLLEISVTEAKAAPRSKFRERYR